MLKIRREWRRTSSSQAEPSPWRHCWTSWASCSNVSSASNPGAVTCAATPGQFLVKPWAAISACHTMERKVPPKCSLRHSPRWPESNRRILLTTSAKDKRTRVPIVGQFPLRALSGIDFVIVAISSCRELAAPEVTRSHLINARTSRKRQHLRSETVETQPNHHFPPVAPAQVLWFFCHRAIYEISSSLLSHK